MEQTDLVTQPLFGSVLETDNGCFTVSNQKFRMQQSALSLKPKFDLLVMLDYNMASKCFLPRRLLVLQE